MYHGTEALPLMVLITNAIPRIFKEYHGTFQYSTTVLFGLVVRSDILHKDSHEGLKPWLSQYALPQSSHRGHSGPRGS